MRQKNASLLLFFVVCPLLGAIFSGEDLLTGGAGRNLIASSGENPLTGGAGRNLIANSGENPLPGVDD